MYFFLNQGFEPPFFAVLRYLSIRPIEIDLTSAFINITIILYSSRIEVWYHNCTVRHIGRETLCATISPAIYVAMSINILKLIHFKSVTCNGWLREDCKMRIEYYHQFSSNAGGRRAFWSKFRLACVMRNHVEERQWSKIRKLKENNTPSDRRDKAVKCENKNMKTTAEIISKLKWWRKNHWFLNSCIILKSEDSISLAGEDVHFKPLAKEQYGNRKFLKSPIFVLLNKVHLNIF